MRGYYGNCPGWDEDTPCQHDPWRHNAVVDQVHGGYQAMCLTDGCGWRGLMRRPNRVVRRDYALVQAESAAIEDGEAHDLMNIHEVLS